MELGMEVGGTLMSVHSPLIVADGEEGEDECVMQHERSDDYGFLCDLDLDPMLDMEEGGHWNVGPWDV